VRNLKYHERINNGDGIKEVLDFTEELFDKVCEILDIDKNEVMK